MAPDNLIRPPHDIELSASYLPGARFSLAWGTGRSRRVLDTDSTELAAALLRYREPMTVGDFAACLTEELSLDADDVVEIVSDLAQHGFFNRGDQPVLRDAWVALGWADALGMHTATAIGSRPAGRGPAPAALAVHDGTGPTARVPAARPPSYRPEPTWSIALPEPLHLGTRFADHPTGQRDRPTFRGSSVSLVDIATIARWTLAKSDHGDFVSPTQLDECPFVGYFVFDRLAGPDPFDGGQSPPHRFAAFAYDPHAHALTYVNGTDALADWSQLLWSQPAGDGAPVAFVLAIDWPRYQWRYPTARAYRWVYTELGSFMRTAVVVARCLGLDSFQTPAIDDIQVGELIRVDLYRAQPLSWANFGRPAPVRP